MVGNTDIRPGPRRFRIAVIRPRRVHVAESLIQCDWGLLCLHGSVTCGLDSLRRVRWRTIALPNRSLGCSNISPVRMHSGLRCKGMALQAGPESGVTLDSVRFSTSRVSANGRLVACSTPLPMLAPSAICSWHPRQVPVLPTIRPTRITLSITHILDASAAMTAVITRRTARASTTTVRSATICWPSTK